MYRLITLTALALSGHAVAQSSGYPPLPSNHTSPAYTTETVTAFTTYCPGPTVLTVNPNKTITVTEECTLTVTDCPCTITRPVHKNETTPYNPPVPPPTTLPPGATTPAPAPENPTKPAEPGATTESGPVPQYTGAASHLGAGLAPLFFGALALLF